MLTRDVDPQHYELFVDTNVDSPNAAGALVFNATVDITMSIKIGGLKTITLHSKELEYKTCTFLAEGAENPIEASDIKLDEGATTVDFVFGPEIPQGSGRLHVEFTGVHK